MLFKELEFCILNIFIHLFVAFLIHFLTIGFGNIFFKFISFNWHGWARFRNLMYTFIIIISCVYSRLKTSLNKFSFKMSFNLFLQQECHSKLFALKVSFEIQDYKNGIKKIDLISKWIQFIWKSSTFENWNHCDNAYVESSN